MCTSYGPVPARVDRRVGADDVVVDEDVAEAELLDALAVGAHRAGVAAEFRLRERHSNSHVHILWVDNKDTVCARGIPSHHGGMTDDRDYPQMAAAARTDRARPAAGPRLSRPCQLVFDTTAARYVWEVPYYPQYYIPLADVATEFLRDENHPQKVQFGPSRLHSLVGRRPDTREGGTGLRRRREPVAGMVRFEWDRLRWFEEDEPIYGHPRNPYARVDALRSHRHVRVELDGVVLADTVAPVLAVRNRLADKVLHRSDRRRVRASGTKRDADAVPLQRDDVGLLVGAGRRRRCIPDLAWTYHYPLPAVAPIAGLVAFYNEKLDIIVDGAALARPKTQFS